ncbi:MAG: WG repeat-containing protein, partial [Saprospiraceae bacterium]
MKNILLFCLLFLCSTPAHLQNQCNNYPCKMELARKALKDGKFKSALDHARGAENYDASKKTEVNDFIDLVFAAIEKKKKEAEDGERKVKIALAETEKAKKQADVERVAADHQRALAQRTLGYFFKNDSIKAAWGLNFGTKKYGVMNRVGELLGGGFIWEDPSPFNEHYAQARKNDSTFFLNKSGEIISEGYRYVSRTEFPHIFFTDEGLISFNGRAFTLLFGASPEVVITEPRPTIFPFIKDEIWGFVNGDSIEVISPVYDSVNIFYFENLEKHIAFANQGKSCELIDLIAGKSILKFPNSVDAWNYIDTIERKRELVSNSNVWSVSDFFDSSDVYLPDSFNLNSKFPVRIIRQGTDSNNETDTTKFYGIFNKSGELLSDSLYESILPFAGDSIFVLMGSSGHTKLEKLFNASTGLYSPFASKLTFPWWDNCLLWGMPISDEDPLAYDFSMYIKPTGEWVSIFNIMGHEIEQQNQNTKMLVTRPNKGGDALIAYAGEPLNMRLDLVGNFAYDIKTKLYEGRIIDTADLKYGLLNADGSVLTPPLFDEIFYPSEGKRAARIGKKWGFIDDSTGWILPFVFDEVSAFTEGRAEVKKIGKWGHINHQGRITTPIIYENTTEFIENLASVKMDSKWGKMDKSGN